MEYEHIPQLVAVLHEPAAAVSCGQHHTLAVTRSGRVVALGKQPDKGPDLDAAEQGALTEPQLAHFASFRCVTERSASPPPPPPPPPVSPTSASVWDAPPVSPGSSGFAPASTAPPAAAAATAGGSDGGGTTAAAAAAAAADDDSAEMGSPTPPLPTISSTGDLDALLASALLNNDDRDNAITTRPRP